MKKYKRLCFLDTETTNVYGNSAAPVQIAAIITDEEGNILSKFNEKIKTTHKIDPKASEVHGIYAKDLINCRGEIDVLTDFCAGMKGLEVDCIITYNGEVFDRPMLNCRCQTLGIPFEYFDKDKFIGIDGYHNCVKQAKEQNLGNLKTKLGRKWKLSLVAELLGFSNENAHDALADVFMLKNVFFKVDPLVHPERG